MILSLVLSAAVLTGSAWYFPLANYSSRQSYKSFGQYIDRSFYIGKESLFPNQFTGYHAGTDLEILPGDENQPVPVYAVTSGKIIFSGPVSGYGGVILESMDNLGLTALYGHLNISGVDFKVGETVSAGSVLTYLGNGFTSQTGGERKHLHFAIYRGSELYFHGYEQTLSLLQQHWIDPKKFLADKLAVNPATLLPTPTPVASTSPIISAQKSFWEKLLRVFKVLFSWLPG